MTVPELRSRLKRWLLINGNRFTIAGIIVAGIFLLLLGLGYKGVLDLENQDAVRGMAGGFIPGLIAFLSIVLSINQLVLSWEFGSPGDIREQIEDVREYRQEVEEMAGTQPSPILPTGFLRFVVRTIESKAGALEASVEPEMDADARHAVETFAKSVAGEANHAGDSLEQVRPGRIHALLPVLEYDDAYQLYEARSIQSGFESDLSSESQERLVSLIKSLELFSVARTQFRTTYTQRVLARLSRQLLYVGLPALAIVLVIGLLQPEFGSVASGQFRTAIVSGLFALAFSPLAVLASYLLRVSTVSERTIAAGPFVSRPKAVEGERRSGPEGVDGHERSSLDPDRGPSQ